MVEMTTMEIFVKGVKVFEFVRNLDDFNLDDVEIKISNGDVNRSRRWIKMTNIIEIDGKEY